MSSLLVTLGDSYTEGVGCYDPSLIKEINSGKIDESQIYSLSRERFLQYAWPVHTARILNFDLLNLAKGGMSNASMAKTFLTGEYTNLRKKYDRVLVIVLLSYNNRLGFFRGGKPYSIIPMSEDKEDAELYKAYLKFLLSDNSTQENMKFYHDGKTKYLYRHDDGLYETAFSIRAIESFCKANNYTFFYGSFVEDIYPLKDLYYSNGNLHSFLHHKAPRSIIELIGQDRSMFSFCSHLNEAGYERVGSELGLLLDRIFIKNQII